MYDEDMKKHPTMNRFHTPFQHISFIMMNLEEEIDPNFENISKLPNNNIYVMRAHSL